MHVTRLEARHLRCFDEISLTPCPGLNLITGANGAGKTSVLEALHLMAYGRSFRGRVRDGLVRAGAPALEVFVEWQQATRAEHRNTVDETATAESVPWTRKAGLRHSGHAWSGRLDGAPVAQLGELCAALAVVSFEPGSHDLITGGSEGRRRFLDWGLFHVEQGFLPLWRRYSRALKQRNALLKMRRADAQMDAWEYELAEAGEPLDQHRRRYLEALQMRFVPLLEDLVPALGSARLEYLPGWRRDEVPLVDALLVARDRDLAAGYTSVGPHRGHWQIHFPGLPGREALSRGQAKLTALSVILSQAEHHAAVRGEWPIIALDDLASELDRVHQARVLERLLATRAQLFVTGTEPLDALQRAAGDIRRFHVEQGVATVLPGR